MANWPDPEDLVKELLADLTATPVHTSLPADLQDRLPLQRVRRIGGSDDEVTDVARVVVETYAATRDGARDLAEQTRQRFKRRRARTSVGIMDRATTEVAPYTTASPNADVRMRTAIYRMSMRRTFT